jgi:hypothetical protein
MKNMPIDRPEGLSPLDTGLSPLVRSKTRQRITRSCQQRQQQ